MSDEQTPELAHTDRAGHVHMTPIDQKAVTARRAVARAKVTMLEPTTQALEAGAIAKGEVLATARIAAIAAAKRTSELIPLCHSVQMTRMTVDIAIEPGVVWLTATAEALDRTGVEMEAMVAASAGALTLYDMLKAIDRGITFEVALLEKRGGKSGLWSRNT